MRKRSSLYIALLTLAAIVGLGLWSRWMTSTPWKAGVAAIEITPTTSMWMSGYASRTGPSEGMLTPLWAKALVLEGSEGNQALIITLDLIGIGRELSKELRAAISERHGLDEASILINTSHTHTGPVVGRNLSAMYALPDEEMDKLRDYEISLKESISIVVAQAMGDLRESVITHGEGEATFAVNRRNNQEAQIVELRQAGSLKGPVDHSVPVLIVRESSRDASLRAILFGYACHGTVLSSMKWSGDYPGYAQEALEERFAGATAMFWAGCGADQNPLPRREVSLAQEYGDRLAKAVTRVVEGEGDRKVEGELRSVYAEVPLAFAQVPAVAELEEARQDEDVYVARAAAALLVNPELMVHVRNGYPYPVQTWSLGEGLRLVSLGGEVVVDYALSVKALYGDQPVWVAGYSHDVMAYIPSQRVLEEGGYEGGGAMRYYGLPGPWADDVEDRILTEIRRQAAVMDSVLVE